MRSRALPTPTIVVLAAFAAFGGLGETITAQAAPPAEDMPQSLRVEHDNTIRELTTLSQHHGAVGVEARKALILFKQHQQREEEFILPPLTLLPQLAEGKVSPDMKWAIDMADRVKAERDKTYQEHTQITDAMNALAEAARKAHDVEAMDFAQSAVADSLNDIELLEPMSILIGDFLKAKLPQ